MGFDFGTQSFVPNDPSQLDQRLTFERLRFSTGPIIGTELIQVCSQPCPRLPPRSQSGVEVEDAFRLAIKKDPKRVGHRYRLIRFYQNDGKTEFARKEIEALVSLYPNLKFLQKKVP